MTLRAETAALAVQHSQTRGSELSVTRMTTAEITAALGIIRAETDLSAKALLLAGLVSELFRERGFEPVVVGGSAIEFYTDGAYMSGDTDICWGCVARMM